MATTLTLSQERPQMLVKTMEKPRKYLYLFGLRSCIPLESSASNVVFKMVLTPSTTFPSLFFFLSLGLFFLKNLQTHQKQSPSKAKTRPEIWQNENVLKSCYVWCNGSLPLLCVCRITIPFPHNYHLCTQRIDNFQILFLWTPSLIDQPPVFPKLRLCSKSGLLCQYDVSTSNRPVNKKWPV